ncbi:MAG: hypothetical protein U5L01_09635 [Rheinheimera sp.]|nr:hypothetical protein [Rheinheimera sp.]
MTYELRLLEFTATVGVRENSGRLLFAGVGCAELAAGVEAPLGTSSRDL